MALRPRLLTVVTVLVAGMATLALSVTDAIQLTYRSPVAHASLESVAALIALLTAYLVGLRFRRSQRLDDLALAGSLALFAATNLLFGAIPAAITSLRAERLSIWAALAGTFLAALLLAASAFAPARKISRPRRAAILVIGGIELVLAMIAFSTVALADHLPRGVDPAIAPERAAFPEGNGVILAVQLVTAFLFAAAAVGLTRRAGNGSGELFAWFGASAALNAFARLNYFLYPSLYSDWVYTGDILRLLAWALMLVGALREIEWYQHRLREAAVLEERRRVARDLHDGLAQELAFIVAQARSLAPAASTPVARLLGAAERALDESRRAISALSTAREEPLDTAVAEAAREVADRAAAPVELELDLSPDVDAAAGTRDAVLRIVKEAITNAVRHGHADRVQVYLGGTDIVQLRIVDNGDGFDPASTRSVNGFGLVSMRERTEALGGQFTVVSEVGRGTEIEVSLR